MRLPNHLISLGPGWRRNNVGASHARTKSSFPETVGYEGACPPVHTHTHCDGPQLQIVPGEGGGGGVVAPGWDPPHRARDPNPYTPPRVANPQTLKHCPALSLLCHHALQGTSPPPHTAHAQQPDVAASIAHSHPRFDVSTGPLPVSHPPCENIAAGKHLAAREEKEESLLRHP